MAKDNVLFNPILITIAPGGSGSIDFGNSFAGGMDNRVLVRVRIRTGTDIKLSVGQAPDALLSPEYDATTNNEELLTLRNDVSELYYSSVAGGTIAVSL